MPGMRSAQHKKSNFCTSLCGALIRGSIDSVRTALIDYKDNINEKNSCGRIPLHFAIQRGCNAEVVKLLVDAGADVNLKNNLGNTSLHMAFDVADEEMIKLLCDYGADVSIENNQGLTAMEVSMHVGHFRCNLNMAKMFFDAGGDINRRTKDGKTFLHLAVPGCVENLIKYLISSGLDVNAKDDYGETPLHYVAESDIFDLRSLRPSKMSKWGRIDERFTCYDTIKILLDNGADPTAINNKGETPLHSLARKSGDKVIELLLNNMKKMYLQTDPEKILSAK